MARVKFSEWKSQLEILMRHECGSVFTYDYDTAVNYWREGYPPEEFFRELISVEPDTLDSDFDIRYDM
jgi:hypothetical protein